MAVLLALAVNVALVLADPAPARVWIHPVAPPMTHIPSMGEKPLGPPVGGGKPGEGVRWALERTLHQSGSPEQRAAAEGLRREGSAVHARMPRSQALRIAVQDDARAAVAVLGEVRVAAFVAEREALSARMGEQKVWRDVVTRLSGAP